MTDCEVEHKFRTLIVPRYGKDRAERILAVCWELEKLKSVRDLIQLFDLPPA